MAVSTTFTPHPFTNGDMMGVYPPPSSDFTLPVTAMASSVDLGKKTMGSESEVTTFNGSVSRKRMREGSSFSADLGFQLHQQQMVIDRIISIHAEKLRVELLEKHRAQSVQILAAVGEVFGKKMKEKEEEIEKMGRVNWILQEKVKSLWIENQLWREMAQTSEATANSLRSNLERVLLAAAGGEERIAGGDAEDCVSSSGSVEPFSCKKTKKKGLEDEADSSERDIHNTRSEEEGGEDCVLRRRMCRKCGVEESIVLVLPCRHLCVCKVCGSSLSSCPVCNSTVNASVRINLT